MTSENKKLNRAEVSTGRETLNLNRSELSTGGETLNLNRSELSTGGETFARLEFSKLFGVSTTKIITN